MLAFFTCYQMHAFSSFMFLSSCLLLRMIDDSSHLSMNAFSFFVLCLSTSEARLMWCALPGRHARLQKAGIWPRKAQTKGYSRPWTGIQHHTYTEPHRVTQSLKSHYEIQRLFSFDFGLINLLIVCNVILSDDSTRLTRYHSVLYRFSVAHMATQRCSLAKCTWLRVRQAVRAHR